MGIPLKVVLEREIEFRKERTIATIYEPESGGPVRPLITGREPHTTGRPVCIKSGFRAVPWESFRGELPFIELAEVTSPVRRIRAQPHQLDMKVTGPEPILTFFPDFELTVDGRLIEELARGTPFWLAALRWFADRPFDARTLIVEVKDDKDPRRNDPDYQHKLNLAEEVYRRLGWSFATVVKSRDLPKAEIAKGVHKVWLKALTAVTPLDVSRASDLIGRSGGCSSYGEVARALESDPLGKNKLAA